MKKNNLVILAVAGVMLLLVASCDGPLAPFDQSIVAQSKDDTAPVVEILSPDDNSVYGQRVIVEGKVVDSGGEIGAIKWTVSGPLGLFEEGSIAADSIDADGFFTFSFDTSDFGASIVVDIEASDWNGNSSLYNLNLGYSGSALPSFSVETSNKSVSLSWDGVAGADTYTLYYTKNGNLPSEVYTEAPVVLTESPAVPLRIDGLKNGELHVFRLKAEGSGGKQWFSSYISAVPASANTFTPRVTGEDERIRVEWDCIAENMGYEIWRAESPEGNYSNISGTIYESPFFDTLAEPGIRYYYKIKPVVEGCFLSGTGSAELYSVTVNEIAELFTCDGAGGVKGVDIADSWLYAVTDDAHLQVYNLIPNDPRYGELMWEVELAGPATGIEVDGEIAYVSEGYNGIEIFGLTADGKRVAPVLFSHFDPDLTPPGCANDVGINPDDSNCLYVADGFNGFRLIDVSNAFDPDYLGLFKYSSSYMAGLSSETDYTYIIDNGESVIRKIDISIQDNPSEDSSFSLSNPEPGIGAVEVYGGHLYVGTMSGLYTIDKNSGAETSYIKTLGTVEDIEVSGERMYVIEGGNTIRVYDITNPDEPTILESKSFDCYFECLKYDNERLICGNADGGISVFGSASVSLPAVELSALNTTNAICETDNALYAAEEGIRRYELQSGELTGGTVLFNRYNGGVITGSFNDIEVQDNNLFGCINDSLFVMRSGASEEFSSCKLPDTAARLTVQGDYAYIGTRSYGLQIVDISDSSAPVIAGFCNTTGIAQTPVIIGDLLCLGDRAEGVALIDISNPAAPIQVGSCMTADIVNDIALSGDHLVAATSSGIEIYDISNPSAPVKTGENNLGGSLVTLVRTAGDNIFAYDTTADEINICIASDPSNPYVVKTIPCFDLDDFTVSGNRLFLLDNGNLKTVDITLE